MTKKYQIVLPFPPPHPVGFASVTLSEVEDIFLFTLAPPPQMFVLKVKQGFLSPNTLG